MIKESKQIITISLLGENEIELQQLTNSLNTIALICGRINGISFPDSKTTIKINKTSAGSFEVEAMVMLALEPNMLNLISDLVSRYVNENKVSEYLLEQMDSLIGIKLFSNGEKFQSVVKNKDGDNHVYQVTNNIGEVNIFSQTPISEDYFTNNNLDKYLSHLAQVASQRDGFQVTSPSGKSIAVDKEKCAIISNNIMANNGTTEKVEEKKVTIYLKRPDLTGKALWEVYLHGQVINVKVLDESFAQKVRDGLQLGSKDPIKVKIKTIFHIDAEGFETGEKPKYEILKVLSH